MVTAGRLTLETFDALVAAAGDDAGAKMTIAHGARRGPLRSRAHAVAQGTLALRPDDSALATIARAIATAGIPRWHFRMLQDEARNAAYADAIARCVRPGMRVLDIGAGSGLLSMMAARAGASVVVGCEMDPVIAAVAREVVAANGLADRVTILDRHSGTIDPDRDMGGQADVILSEILGKDLVSERVLPVLRDAARRLLKPGGQMVPGVGTAQVALAEWPGRRAMRVDGWGGFDLSAFNGLTPPSIGVKVGDPTLTLRSAAETLIAFDFHATAAQPASGAVELTSAGGRIDGVVQWIGLQLSPETWFENRPGPGATSSWSAVFHPFDAPLELPAGTRVPIGGRAIDDCLLVWRGG